jgi:drug/metabolite transporter (DMT)-like permease
MLFGSGSQVVFKAVLNETGPLTANGFMLEQMFVKGKLLHLFAAFAMLVIAFLFWTLSLSRLELSYAYSIACSSALIVALLSALFLGEVVTARAWVGIVLIVVGIAMLWSPR